jgi:hypothetical protein
MGRNESIRAYFDYFKEAHQKILSFKDGKILAQDRLHQKILMVTFLDALARGR